MFNDISIVATAVSSFNNAALVGPYFFVVGLFTLPLFAMVFLYGRDFMSKLKLTNRDIEEKMGFWTVSCLALWLMVFGGNYAVIRDSISLLSFVIAIILFASMVYVTNRIQKYKYLEKIRDTRKRWFLFLFVLLLAGVSALPTWWGILLQISAVLCGIIVGCRFNKKLSDLFMSTSLFGITTVLFLMQPEYFRFGQLGNLTLVHIMALLLCGFFCVTTLATGYTKAKGKIYNSTYVKLKWLCRILALLALILFVLTESVPVFVGMLVMTMLSEMLTIYHGKTKSEYLVKQSWGLLFICFGIMIICPLISMLGLIYLMSVPNTIDFKDFTRLL